MDVLVYLILFYNGIMAEPAQNSGVNNGSYISTSNKITKSESGIESYVLGPLKVWHICGLSITFVMIIVVIVCCCVDVRIPRPRHQIEQSYQRRKLHSKYGERFFSLTTSAARLEASRVQQNHKNVAKQELNFKDLASEDASSAANQGRFGLYTGKGLSKIRPAQSEVIKTLSSLKPKSTNNDTGNR